MVLNEIYYLLKPRLWGLVNQGFSKSETGKFTKYIFLSVLGMGFWFGIYFISLRVLKYFARIEQLGDILAFKLLSMLLITIFSLLIFSSILTSLSKHYLSRDLSLVHAMPIESYKIFWARWIEVTVDSSWMVILYTLPVFVAYAVIYHPGGFYYIAMTLVLIFLSIIASAISCILIMLAVIVVPASRIRSIFVFVGLSLFILLYIAFRVLRPERLVDPEAFSATLFYLRSLQAPSSPYLPSTWAYDALMAAFKGDRIDACFHLGISMTFSGVIFMVMICVADMIYFKGLSKAQTASVRLFGKRRLEMRPFKRLPGPVRALVVKEIKTFFRDQTQWSQLFLVGALIAIYIYNFKVLPLDKSPIKTIYLQNLLSFLNMGLALFVLTAIAGRFAFPAVSLEREAIWMIQAGPVRLSHFLWVKFWVYFIPMLCLTLMLIIGTNVLLQVGGFMMGLSCITVCCMVPGVISLGIGMGAAFPDFKAQNPVQTITSYGGLLFMIFSAAFIGSVIMLEAEPVYRLFLSQVQERQLSDLDRIWSVIAFSLSAVLCGLAIVLPMRYGEKKLTYILTKQ